MAFDRNNLFVGLAFVCVYVCKWHLACVLDTRWFILAQFFFLFFRTLVGFWDRCLITLLQFGMAN